MRKLILFTLLVVLSLAGFSQNFGRLRIHSGLYDNLVINGPDTSVFGWRTDRFSLGTDNTKSLEFLLNGVHSGLVDSSFNVVDGGGATHFGYRSGEHDTAQGNSYFGYFAGKNNVSGFSNVAFGAHTLESNTSSSYNTAIGQYSMRYSLTGGWNTAVGQAALMLNAAGQYNTVIGEDSYMIGNTGSYNTAVGAATLINCKGSYNTVIGNHAGNKLTTGNLNIFIGNYAGYWGNWTQKGFIDVYDRSDSASQLTSSPIVIDFNVDSSLQKIRFNVGDIEINKLHFGTDSIVLADDAGINLQAGAYGELRIYVFNAGTYDEWATAIINSDGSVYLISNSTDVTTTGGTDNKFNIYDAGSNTTIENKLGGNRTVKYIFTH